MNYYDGVGCIIFTADDTKRLMDELKQLEELARPPEPTINQLKRAIKYSKNPLKTKQLQKQLNDLYKGKRNGK